MPTPTAVTLTAAADRPRQWPARYRPQEIGKYRGNPFLEALPPVRSPEEALDLMAVYPEYDPDARRLPDHLRLHELSAVSGLVQPLSEHADLEVRVSRMLRDGYLRRNPLDPDFQRQALVIEAAFASSVSAGAVRSGAAASGGTPPGRPPHPPTAVGGGAEDDAQRDPEHDGAGELDAEFRVDQRARARATGMTLLGISGVGKTTALERIFALYPQVIAHREYQGRALPRLQLVWLKLECPFDGSIRGLCINFFGQVDAILGTDYSARLVGPRDTAETLLPKMARVAWQHGVGIMAIDEIQHLSQAKSGGEQRMLNFFVTLVNTIGLPVLLVGTYKASKILAGEFRQARRGCGQGDFVWDAMEQTEKKNPDWLVFVRAVAGYQYTLHESPLTEALIQTLYDESQGITAIVVLLWILAQERAIVTGQEVVTPDLVESVAKDRLHLLRPMLQALKAKDYAALRELGDVLQDVLRANILPTGRSHPPRAERQATVAGSTADAGVSGSVSPATSLPRDGLPTAPGDPRDAGAAPRRTATPSPARKHSRRASAAACRPGPAGSLPRLVADAMHNEESPHAALRAHGLLFDPVCPRGEAGGSTPATDARSARDSTDRDTERAA